MNIVNGARSQCNARFPWKWKWKCKPGFYG